MLKERKNLSTKSLLKFISNYFMTVEDKERKRSCHYSLKDCLMAGLAIFGLKYPSLLQFEKERKENEPLIGNLERLYNIDEVPCDTTLRERLDAVNPSVMRKAFNIVIAKTQRDKVLEDFKFMDNRYLLSIDGTGYFHSKDVFCENCCEKRDKEGNIISYHHNLLAGSIVHPNLKTVIPIAPEPIVKQDGVDKNDCELNAAKRLLPMVRTEHPHLKIIIVADALSANAPFVGLCKENDFNYIIVAKESDHKHLFETFRNANCEVHAMVLENGNTGEFSYINDVALNKSNPDCKVNFLYFREIKKNGKISTWTWITDITIEQENLKLLMRGGRSRWKIENETFNTLKNQGYNFEHNYGHGNKHLSTILAMLMMLAFMIDQIQQHSCPLFNAALEKAGAKYSLWEKIRGLFFIFYINSWRDVFLFLIKRPNNLVLEPDTS
jgi:hypothetical protein